VLGLVLAAALCGATTHPVQTAAHYLLRETYRLCEAVGIMRAGGPLGGQVVGFNYQRRPEWVHPVARSATHAVAMTPALVFALLIYHRAAFGRLGLEQTLCGACGRARRADGPCPCGHEIASEPADLKSGWLAGRIGPARSVLLRRLLAAWVAGAIIASCVVVRDDWQHLRLFFIELGRRLGGEVVRVDIIVMSEHGPFYGDGLRPQVLNFICREAPGMVTMLSGLAGAIIVYHAGVRWLWRVQGLRRLFGYTGPTLCGRCGYRLAGNRSGRCPECGGA